MRVCMVTDTGAPTPRHAVSVPSVCVGMDASASDVTRVLREPTDACVVCCALRPTARRVLCAVAPLTRGCCVVLDCAYSNVLRLFGLRDVLDAWDHVVLVGESDDGGLTLPIYHMGSAPSRERAGCIVAALFPRARARECADLFDRHLFACGASVAALLPETNVGLALREIHDMRTVVHERATLCADRASMTGHRGTWAYCRVLWRFRRTQLLSTAARPPILWDILLFFYCVCRTFSLPCNHIGTHVHHGELEGLADMMTDRAYVMRTDTVCACLHWLHSNRATRVSCVLPMVCARTIDVRGHWVYALQTIGRRKRADAEEALDARRADWTDKPTPHQFLAYDDAGGASIRAVFPSARAVRRVATVEEALRAACKEKRPGVSVISGKGVLANISAALYARVSSPQWPGVRYAPADGVFLRMDPL